MSDQNKLVLAIVLVAVGLVWPKIKNTVTNIDIPTTTSSSVVNVDFEVMPEPSDSLKQAVKGISDLVTGNPDAENDKIRLAQFYAQLSNVVRNEPGFLASTGQFRSYNAIVGQINFAGQSLKGKYSGLGAKVDQVIISAIGDENAALSPEKRKALADILAAISWELWHANN